MSMMSTSRHFEFDRAEIFSAYLSLKLHICFLKMFQHGLTDIRNIEINKEQKVGQRS